VPVPTGRLNPARAACAALSVGVKVRILLDVATAPPSFVRLAEASDAALEKAKRLLGDAELLLAAGRWPTAHALAVLALEEYGKCMLLSNAALSEEPFSGEEWQSLSKRLGSHTEKLGTSFGVRTVLENEGLEETVRQLRVHEELVAQEAARKMRGLYVDLTADTLELPDSIDEHASRTAVAGVKGALDLAEQMPLPGHLLSNLELMRATAPSVRAAVDKIVAMPFEEALEAAAKVYRELKARSL